MSRGSKRPSRIDQVLAGAEVLDDEYTDFNERAGLENIARRVVWDSASSMALRARWIRTESGADDRPTDTRYCPVPAALHERAASHLEALSAHVVRDPAAIADMALLVDDRATIEPGGALAFACLLYLAGSHEAAQFWWQFAAGADSCTAAQCLYLHHLQHSELRDAQHWRAQALALNHLGKDPMLQATPRSWRDGALPELWPHIEPPNRTMSVLTVFEVDDLAAGTDHACTPAVPSLPLSDSISEAVQRLEADSDADFGTIPKPDPDLAAELEDCVASAS